MNLPGRYTLAYKPNKITVLLLLLILVLVYFSFQSPYFLTVGNIMNVFNQMTEIGLIAIPMTLIIISGAMDLSVGSILGLSALAVGMSYQSGFPIWVSILIALVVGSLSGAVNGYLIARHKMQAIVVTIGMLVMLRGLIYVLNEGRPISGYPDAFYFLGQGYVFGIPFNAIFLIVMFVLACLS
jgi:ribose/xylose/arabinose/galactoside ABC-type transport system permease subunit